MNIEAVYDQKIGITIKMLKYYYKKAKSMTFNINYGFDINNEYVICTPFLIA